MPALDCRESWEAWREAAAGGEAMHPPTLLCRDMVGVTAALCVGDGPAAPRELDPLWVREWCPLTATSPSGGMHT